MTPVATFIVNPAGSDGEILYETTFPVTDGDKAEIGTPIVNVFGVAYASADGITS